MNKIFGVLFATISLTGCGTTYYADQRINTHQEFRPISSVITLAYNIGATSAYSVPKGSRLEHENCVYMVLDNAQVGESCDWKTDEARGSVRVAYIRPNLCHNLISTVHYKGKSVRFEDIACPSGDKWKFYDR